jgi:hypothetical protein
MSIIIRKLWDDIFKQRGWDAEGFCRQVEDYRKAKAEYSTNYISPLPTSTTWTMTTTTTRPKPSYHPARSGKRWR